MNIDDTTIVQAIAALSLVEAVHMEATDLAEDATLLTLAFPEPGAYKTAVANTLKALKDIAGGRVSSSTLGGTFEGWESYHYQPKVGQNVPADMRIIFQREGDAIKVLAFGHRYIPSSLYRRTAAIRRER